MPNDKINPWTPSDDNKLVKIVMVSIPSAPIAMAMLEQLVEDLGGTIPETVLTDKADVKYATIVFDEDLDN